MFNPQRTNHYPTSEGGCGLLIGGGITDSAALVWVFVGVALNSIYLIGASGESSSSEESDWDTPAEARSPPPWIPNGEMAGEPRSVSQLEEALREWLKANRRLHESRRATLVRALVAEADLEKNMHGGFLRSPECVRQSHAFGCHHSSDRYFRQCLRKSAFDFPESQACGPTLESCDVGNCDTTIHQNKAWKDDIDIERWAQNRQHAIQRADERRGYSFTCGGKVLDQRFMGQLTDRWKPPSAKRASSKVELAQERKVAQEKDDPGRTSPERFGISQVHMTPQDLIAAWKTLLKHDERELGWSPLAYPLTLREAMNLISAHGRTIERGIVASLEWSELRDTIELDGTEVRPLVRELVLDSLIEAIVADPGHTLSNVQVRKGAPTPGEGENDMEKIVARPCRTGLYAPSDFDMETECIASRRPPTWELQLEHVHGYGGLRNTAPNLFYTNDGKFVYYTAAVGVLAQTQPGTREFVQNDTCCPDPTQGTASPPTAPSTQASGCLDRDVHSMEGSIANSEYQTGEQVDALPLSGDESSEKFSLTVQTPGGHRIKLVDSGLIDLVSEKVNKPNGDGPIQLLGVELCSGKMQGSRKSPQVGGWTATAYKSAQHPHTSNTRVLADESQGYGELDLTVSTLQTEASRENTEIEIPTRNIAKHRSNSAPFSKEGVVQCAVSGYEDETCKEIKRIYLDEGSGGLCALAFSGKEGRLLTAVALDNAHTVSVFDWESGRKLGGGIGYKGVPPQVLGCVWDEMSENGEEAYLTFGIKHVKIWTQIGPGSPSLFHAASCSWSEKDMSQELEFAREFKIPCDAGRRPHAVRCFDVDMDRNLIIVGTRECDIWEFFFGPSLNQKTAQSGAESFFAPQRLVSGHASDLYALATHPSKGDVYATACHSKEVQVWSSSKRRRIGSIVTASGPVESVAFSEPHGKHLALGLATGAVEVFNQQRTQIAFHKRCGRGIRDIKYSPDGKIMATGGHDMVIDLYKVAENYRPEWHTWTSKVGFPVLGIWPDGCDGSDINSVCVDPKTKSMVAAADDFGNVRLYRYPCVVEDAGCRIEGGHSAHVMMCRFTCDGERVISVGGRDRAVCQWRVKRAGCSASRGETDCSENDAAKVELQESRAVQAASFLKVSLDKQLRELKRKKSSTKVHVNPLGKVWGPVDRKGVRFGWIDSNLSTNSSQATQDRLGLGKQDD
ncbi:hypothetical protein BSKO_11842 [Bryopsis sp. KO-2023]|nr:hypothetical protein BSKO_11842 [Bryopsis sp. KO-2023]